MKRILRSSLSSFIYYGNRWRGYRESGTRILCYHRVSDEQPDYLSVPVACFKEQMQWLASEGYRTCKLPDLLNGDGGFKKVLLTFDDGYKDNYTEAFPILREFGLEALIFCVGEKIGKPGYLNLIQIHTLRQAGLDFGSHTLTHPHLPQLSPDEKWNEISGSKKFLEGLFGFEADSFCYPFGEFDRESVDMVRRAGYHAACSNIPGSNQRRIHPYLLKRTEISGFDTLGDFKKKVSGAYDLMHQGLHWARGRP